MTTAPKHLCPIEGCSKLSPSVQGISQHITRSHKAHAPSTIARKDGQVEIDLKKFTNEKLPEPVPGGFKRSFFLAPMTGVVTLAWVAIIFSVASSSILNAAAMVLAYPFVVFASWWFTQQSTYTKVAVIRKPPDADGRVRLVFEWWLKRDARLLPQEAKRTGGMGEIYVIDVTGEKPVAFTPFTVTPPEYAIPARGAMVNQQIDNEQLNKVHYKGIRPEVIEKAFALAVIGGLILANYAVFSQLIEFNS